MTEILVVEDDLAVSQMLTVLLQRAMPYPISIMPLSSGRRKQPSRLPGCTV